MSDFPELDALCASPWADVPGTLIPADWRDMPPPKKLLRFVRRESGIHSDPVNNPGERTEQHRSSMIREPQ